MTDRQAEPSPPPAAAAAGSERGRKGAKLSTPVAVGSMAALILGIAFLVAIVRGGSGAPGPGEVPPPRRPGQAAIPAGGAPPAGKLAALSPQGPAPMDGLSFNWAPGDGLVEYRISIFDPLMKKMWASPKTTELQVVPPGKVMALFRAGTPYRWNVTGFSASGTSVESDSVTFRLVE